MGNRQRTFEDWYQDAARCYLEGHQACAWCGFPYQVFKIETATGVDYHCNRCDFHTGHDLTRDQYRFVAGLGLPGNAAPVTMHGC